MSDEMGTFRTDVEIENPARPGARSLEGLNLHVDPIGKRLIDAGPMPAAAAG
jgi:hypothetical protein